MSSQFKVNGSSPDSFSQEGQQFKENSPDSHQPTLALTEVTSRMTSSRDEQTTAQIWAKTQLMLQRQLTRATYETLIQGTKLLPLLKGTYCIQVPTAMSRDWLEYRLKLMIMKALTSVVGHEVEIQFVLAPEPTPGVDRDATSTSPLSEPLTVPAAIPPTASPCARFAQEIDFQSLWFEKGRSSGYTQVPDYAFQFWMLYLNQIKPKAFDLWCRILSDDKRNIHDPNFTFWTPPKKYSLRALARVVGTTSVITVSGGPRSCWFNEQAKKVTGAPLPQCCGRYQPAKWHQTTNETIRCLHWQTGLLEVLAQEGLIALDIIKPPPGKPRAHEIWLQVWRNIPVLTPFQVSQLNEIDQVRHAQWLERYGHYQNIDLARWEQLTDARSLIWLLPDYDLQPSNCPTCRRGCSTGCQCRCHHSRRLWSAYQPSQDLFE
ncbi:MAG: hypothetical protein DPW09_42695 [Anaerolineae bacterium]|nr:hypothetical protein [Anaerolineae bacterium]